MPIDIERFGDKRRSNLSRVLTEQLYVHGGLDLKFRSELHNAQGTVATVKTKTDA